MSLIETRASYMHRLQTLIDARQKDIDDKVGALRAKLEAEQIQPYRAQLEAEKVTPEMNKLVEFINDIDAMLAYENTETTSIETAEQTSETIEHEEVEQVADHSVAEEVSEETETFHGASKIKIRKQLANTTDEAEKAKLEAANLAATTNMLNVCNELIANAETLYSDVSSILKKEGKSAGAVKKDSVMSKLQAYAIEYGYEFDAEYWDKKVDEIVDMTKKVNVSK